VGTPWCFLPFVRSPLTQLVERVSQQVAEAQHNRVWRQRQRVRRFIEQIASIERQLGIYDLNKVTLAAPGAA